MRRNTALIAIAIALCACSGQAPAPVASASSPRSTPTATPTPTPTPTPSPSRAPTPSASPASCAQTTLARLTLGQRVGQLFFLGVASDHLSFDEASAIDTYHFGSVTFTATSYSGTATIHAFSNAVQAHATTSATGGVRFFVAANQEGGEIQALRGPGFSTVPSAVTQGGLSTTELRADAAAWGRQLRDAGVNLDYAPVIDVVPPGTDAENAPIGALHREYGHHTATVSAHGVAFLQGMADAGVLTSAKHFPGLGRVSGNTDFVSGVTDAQTTVGDPYLATFRAAIGAGVPLVMVATALYTKIDPSHLGAFSHVVVTDLLRHSLGYQGVVVSDEIGVAKAVSRIPLADRGIDVLLAGGDMVISKTVPPAIEMWRAIDARAAADTSFRALVDAAALRVLELKDREGLLPCSS